MFILCLVFKAVDSLKTIILRCLLWDSLLVSSYITLPLQNHSYFIKIARNEFKNFRHYRMMNLDKQRLCLCTIYNYWIMIKHKSYSQKLITNPILFPFDSEKVSKEAKYFSEKCQLLYSDTIYLELQSMMLSKWCQKGVPFLN